jgi:hypothetical protein
MTQATPSGETIATLRPGDRVRVVACAPSSGQVYSTVDEYGSYFGKAAVDLGNAVVEVVTRAPFIYHSNLRMDGRSRLEFYQNGHDVHIRIYDNDSTDYNVAVVEAVDVERVAQAMREVAR